MALSRHHGLASQPLSVHQISEEAQNFDYTDNRPLLSWLRSAKMLLSEATACETEGNIQLAYLYTYRHAELVLAKLPHHPDARNPKFRDAINQARKQVNANFAKLEAWKPRINQQHDRYIALTQRRIAAREEAEQQRRTNESMRRLSIDPDEQELQEQRKSLDAHEHHQLAVEIARRELSRREGLKQPFDTGYGHHDDDKLARDIHAVGLLAQNSTRPETDRARMDDNTDYLYPVVPAKESSRTGWPSTAHSHSQQATVPHLPPKLPSHNPTSPPPRPHKEVADAQRYKFKVKATTEAGAPLRSVILPSELSSTFLNIARPNTQRDLETCGVLCATTISNALFINHLVIPDQTCTSDTCDATEEGDIALFDFCDKENLLVCGWIHTHPTQTCFMSSRDLHTSSGYQQMLPEAIAIVCAPQHTPDRGIFRLTDPPGLPAVLKCSQKGLFHPHAESDLYTDANSAGTGHVIEAPHLGFKVVDLRKRGN